MKFERPVIGITTSLDCEKFFLNRNYVKAVEAAGGAPILLPPVTENAAAYLEICGGVLISGGGDVDPARYGEAPHEKTGGVYAERDGFEIALIELIIKMKKPALCICRGMQVLNVACGGSLKQHIENHFQKEGRGEATHAVEIVPGTELYKIFSAESIDVNTYHHQAVCRVGNNLTVSAKSKDGEIEATEHDIHKNLIGVQWHPEGFADDKTNANGKVFEWLITKSR